MFLLLLMRDYGGIKVLLAACFLASPAFCFPFSIKNVQVLSPMNTVYRIFVFWCMKSIRLNFNMQLCKYEPLA